MGFVFRTPFSKTRLNIFGHEVLFSPRLALDGLLQYQKAFDSRESPVLFSF